jgi:hypothetical protein
MTGTAPQLVVDFLLAYLRARGSRVDDVLDPWADNGWLLPRAVEALQPARAVGLLSAGVAPPLPGVVWRVVDAGRAVADRRETLDVVLGVPPWGWAPREARLRSPDGDLVTLVDDPANVLVVRSCMLLRRGGVGLFVVAPGFVMRPGPGTVFPNLPRFGLGLEALVALPRGAFLPDTGSGRFLVALSPKPPAEPIIGTLGADGGSGDLLARVCGLSHDAEPDAAPSDP